MICLHARYTETATPRVDARRDSKAASPYIEVDWQWHVENETLSKTSLSFMHLCFET